VFTKNVWSTKPTGHAIISGSAVTDGDPKLSSYNFPIGKIMESKELCKKWINLKWKSSPYVNKRFVYILNCCIFFKYDVLSEYLIPF
jgi:hypothetical protein